MEKIMERKLWGKNCGKNNYGGEMMGKNNGIKIMGKELWGKRWGKMEINSGKNYGKKIMEKSWGKIMEKKMGKRFMGKKMGKKIMGKRDHGKN